MEKPKFIVDTMCGRLAKWLRLLGFDTLYFREGDDSQLLELSIKQNRILITRDTGLIKRKNIKQYLFITANNSQKQLAEVTSWMIHNNYNPPEIQHSFTRCTVCNGNIKKIPKKEVVGLVPNFVYDTHTSFYKCSVCHHIYWEGSHIRRIKRTLSNILNTAEC